MENRGGGRTPRGKKGRGRGRGGGQFDSPSSRSPASSSAASSPAQSQSPTVSSSSSSASTPVPATTPTRDDQQKVTATSKQRMSTPPSLPQESPQLKETEDVKKESPPPTPSPQESKKEEKGDEVKAGDVAPPPSTEGTKKEEKVEEVKLEDVVPPPTTKEPEKRKEEKVGETVPPPAAQEKVEDDAPPPTPTPVSSSLEEPILPQEKSASISSPGGTEQKMEEVFARGLKPPIQAKTFVVEPADNERSTDAPLTVEIEQSTQMKPEQKSGGRGMGASPSSQGHTRSGSISPAYALIAPIGKTGYIGGVGISGEEVDSGGRSRPPGIVRRESAIAAVETAVKGFSKRQWILLIMFGLIDLLSAITISLQAPFYPAEAERKGANATEYGFVFGIFEFMVFLTSPIFGKYMHKLGPKTVFSVGILVTSVAVISFGLLDKVNDHTTFIALCLVCRCFEALGCAGFFTATFTIIACEFPASVSTTFASLETFFGLGLIVGPTVGGALFGVGGFPLPFFVVGSCLLLTGLASSFVMPKMGRATEEETKNQAPYGILSIIKIPTVALAAVSIASTSLSLGFVSATMEPHIRRFNLTPFQTGLVFIVNGGVYALTAPIFGYICDNIRRPIFVTIVGNVFIFISFLLIGPAAFMPFDTILWVSIVGLIIQGLGFGCCLVSGFIVGLQDSIKHGLPDELGTYAIVSGLWTSMISLGAWVGPVLAGILYDNFGFRQASWLVLGTSAVVGVTIFIHTCCDTFQPRKSDSEAQPLLRPLSPLLGKKDIEEPKPSTSYGSTGGGGSGGGGDTV